MKMAKILEISPSGDKEELQKYEAYLKNTVNRIFVTSYSPRD